MTWSTWPIVIVDLAGALLLLGLAAMSLGKAHRIGRRTSREDPLGHYLTWLCLALLAFALSRSLAHVVKYLLLFSGRPEWWARIAPVTGAVNTLVFVVIASVTLFFDRIQRIVREMEQGRDRLRRISRELLRVNREVEDMVAERTQAEMALRLAHEVRNPVSIMGGLLRRSREDLPDRDGLRERIDRVLEQAEHLEALLRRLEGILEARRRRLVVLDLGEVAAEVVLAVEEEARDRGVSIFLERSPSRLSFRGDRHLLRTAVNFLFRQALDALGPGGRLRASTGMDEGGGLYLEVAAAPLRPGAFPGGAEEPGGETGYRMAFVRQVVEEHRGSLAVLVTPDGEGRFRLRVPTHLGVLDRRRPGPAGGESDG
ncbi:HAMP domain-containing histidine kinase [Dissulfurirhabdus thermomarina]|uniref:histidine kinase n=1 Tax=Dissulfurirhabdus thermomarina TaxID=1765737 RepID=A0A6N9TSH6_DISTH|nr:HAMP domain-containing sensor histidine kinase [Dissulfurirhabdus thermomarina]NDY42397.1 HAMP domain-containing histidine kinase [Dissulfurirhabdus thermomarina]NMX23233.1 HAMP domain-containing histidine kinase [Dissulfurirhabdus thermomarina]